ncbi:MAG: hypothetical protein EZS28_018931, partial [Streblomastix strix]
MTDPLKADSIRSPAQVQEVNEQIRVLQEENKKLKADSENTALQQKQKIDTLESDLQKELEDHGTTKKKLQELEDSSSKEKQLRMQTESDLQREQEDRKEAQEKEKDALTRLRDKEEERRKIELAKKFETEEKNVALKRKLEAEESEKVQVESRRKFEKENKSLSYDNDKLKNDFAELKQKYEQEKNFRTDFESKYNGQILEQDRIKKQIEEEIAKRLKAEIIIEKQQKDAQEQIEKDKIKITEQEEKLKELTNTLLEKTEEIERQKQKSIKDEAQIKEEEEKRKQAETEKGNIEGENWILKKDIDSLKAETFYSQFLKPWEELFEIVSDSEKEMNQSSKEDFINLVLKKINMKEYKLNKLDE